MQEFDADDPAFEVLAAQPGARITGSTIMTQPVKLHIGGGMPWGGGAAGSNSFAQGPIVLPDPATADDEESDVSAPLERPSCLWNGPVYNGALLNAG